MRRRTCVALLLALLAAGCRSADADREFLAGQGWTVEELLAEHTVRLPDRFADEPGAFPVGFYWAVNNELSRDVGLDFSSLAGAKVIARLYQLAGTPTLPGDHPSCELRAVILRYRGRLVGAYLDRGGHYGFAASLGSRGFAEVTGRPFGEWLEEGGVVDWDHPAYRELAGLSPEDVVRAFFTAIDRGDYDRAYALLSLAQRTWYLFASRDPRALYNPGFRHNFGLENMREARVVTLKAREAEPPAPGDLNRRVFAVARVDATVEVSFAQVVDRRSGLCPFFVSLVRETPRAPWLIDGYGSGP